MNLLTRGIIDKSKISIKSLGVMPKKQMGIYGRISGPSLYFPPEPKGTKFFPIVPIGFYMKPRRIIRTRTNPSGQGLTRLR